MITLAIFSVATASLFTIRQVSYWRDSTTLWERTRDVTADNFFTRTHLGQAYLRSQRLDDAEEQFETALRLRPDLPLAYDNLGSLYLRQGRSVEAEACFRGALSLEPSSPLFRVHLIEALKRQKRFDEAEEESQKTTAVLPGRAVGVVADNEKSRKQ